MALPDVSVRRPVAVLTATLAVTVFGALALQQLPVELLPDLSYPTLTVRTAYPDAAPVSVEQFVTRPIEESVGVIQGLREMRSTSRAGLSEVVLEFDWDELMDYAALDVREKLGVVQLPREAEPPQVLRYDPSLDPIIRLALGGDRGLDELRELADRWLERRLEAVPGIAAVKVRGGFDPEIHVEVNADRLALLRLTPADVAGALRAANVNQPGGVLKDWGAVYLVRTLNEFESLEQIRRTVIREDAGGLVRVGDVATVRRGHRDRVDITRAGGREVVELALHKEGSANTVRVSEAVAEELERIREELGAGLTLEVLSDQSRYIAEAIRLVWSAAGLGGLLAVLVLYFFLRELPSTLIVALTIPVSVVATFLPMQQAGVTLNIMSLGGLALGVGMLVDNSIVVLEAIDRRRRAGDSRREAARRGAGEVAGAVTAATLTTVSVFLPIVFVQGVAGQLFYDLAVTVCLSLAASLIVSLTLIPSLAGLEAGGAHGRAAGTLFRWDRRDPAEDGRLPWTLRLGPLSLPPVGDGRHGISRALTVLLFPLRLALLVAGLVLLLVWWAFRALFDALSWPAARLLERAGGAYPRLLRGALRARLVVLPLALAALVLALAGLPLLGTKLVPDLTQGEFAFKLRLPEGTPLENTAALVERIEAPLLADGRFDGVFAAVGNLPAVASGRQSIGENLAQINLRLPPGSGVAAEARAVERVRRVLAGMPQVSAELVRPSVLTLRPSIVVNLFADDLDAVQQASRDVVAALGALDGVADVGTTAEPGSPEIRVELDAERAGALGVDAEWVGRSLRHQIRGELAGQFREGENRLDIRVRGGERERTRSAEVSGLRIRLPDGTAVPVSAVAGVEVGRGPAAIHRVDGARVAQVSATTGARDLGGMIERVRGSLAAVELPAGVSAELAGQQEELEVSFRSLRLALLLAVFLVYVVMAMQFESLVHPLVILFSVPLGVIGVVAGLLVTGTPVSVLVLIGAVMLAGIVVNNAIVFVDAINRRRRGEGQALDDAVTGAGRERLRPILMTTATTVLALLPMALGLGPGDELRAPLAITVIGGLTVATLLTLIVVPCVYRLLARGAPGDAGAPAGAGLFEADDAAPGELRP